MKRFLSLFSVLLSFSALAQNYPELMVAPKATERLNLEGDATEGAWSMYLPLQVSAAATLASGILAQGELDKSSDPNGVGAKAAMAIGASWLAASIYLQSSYRPYSNSKSKKMPYKTTQEQLAAERIAEEQIDAAARMARKIKWFAVATNLGANLYAHSSAKENSVAQGVAIFGAAASLLPVIFPMRYEQVSEDHRTYKKRVFGPISFQNTLLLDPATARLAPGLMAGTTF
jgi:hypothetical protein